MRAVVDANVLVSAMLSPHGPPAQVVGLALQGVVVPLYDGRILAEYRDVLGRAGMEPRFIALLPPVEVILERGPGRAPGREPDEAGYRELHRQFVESRLPSIDPTGMTPVEVADAVLALSDR